MFGCYRRSDAADADTYVAAVAMVLAHYSADVVQAVTDPFGGLPSRKTQSGYSGLPDVADVKVACEDEAKRQHRMTEFRAFKTNFTRLPAPPPLPGSRANLFVAAGNPGYAQMVERSKTADAAEWKLDPDGKPGILVSLAWYEDFRSGRSAMKRVQDKPILTPEQVIEKYQKAEQPAAPAEPVDDYRI